MPDGVAAKTAILTAASVKKRYCCCEGNTAVLVGLEKALIKVLQKGCTQFVGNWILLLGN